MSQWTNDAEDTAKTETTEDAEERQEMEDEAYRKRLPENSNKDLIMEFTVQLRKMRNKCLGHKHYCTKEWPTTLSCCYPRTY